MLSQDLTAQNLIILKHLHIFVYFTHIGSMRDIGHFYPPQFRDMGLFKIRKLETVIRIAISKN